MQFLIDTATDSPVELYRIGRFLVERFETVPAAPQCATPEPDDNRDTPETGEAAAIFVPVAAPPPPAAPLTMTDVVGDDDPEVEIDDEGNVTALATSVTLPVAPPPPTPAPPGPAVAPQLDSRGYPWDGRIHASNRATKIDGSWKNKRGVDANLIVAVEAQNKPGNAPSPAATATIPDGSTATAPSAVAVAAPAVTSAPAAPPPPPAPTVGNAAPGAVAPSVVDFRGLMQKIQAATAAGKLSTDQVNGALAGVGLKPEEMAQLINNAPLIASVNAAIDSCLVS